MRVQSPGSLLLSPSDLSNFLSCRHAIALDLRAARGEIGRPVLHGPMIDQLRARGLAHERAYLEHLRVLGLRIAEAGGTAAGENPAPLDKQAALEAMQAGVDIIYQATLTGGGWSGRADFLRRTAKPSRLGDWSYEVIDTKLAQETRAGTVLQLCVYTHLLEQIQDARPESMYVVAPGTDFEAQPYRTDDYAAYFRLLQRDLREFIGSPAGTYPEQVTHCELCAWWAGCDARRRADDHLCHVAGISRGQIQVLREWGIDRLADLARLDIVRRPDRGSREALTRTRDQARIQQRGRTEHAPVHELRQPFDGEHGFALLPEPAPGDIFLDFEGTHFNTRGVSEYLTGYLAPDPRGRYVYTPLWARTLAEERAAFESFVQLATATRARHPGAHIYHFAHYEPTALKRLAGRHACCEVELDTLLRGKAFVDLHRVVRRSLIASVERYSIKDLEPFFDYGRQQDLRDAAWSRRIIEQALEAGDWSDSLDAHCRTVEDYNREDCESTVRLRDWLERLRADVVATGREIPRPEPAGGEASEKITDLDQSLQALREALLQGVAADPQARDAPARARYILAHLMEFHRREDKAVWWEYFRLLDLEPEDLCDERRAVTGLAYAGESEEGGSFVHRYRYPPQEVDARTGKDTACQQDGTKIGGVVGVNYGARTLDIAKRREALAIHPDALILHSRVDPKVLRESLMAFGRSVLQEGFAGQKPYRAAQALLLRQLPVAAGEQSLQQAGEDAISAACRVAARLDGQVLAIQGPPGTGKTHTGAQIICALKRQGLKVGVTAVSHRVIRQLLEKACQAAAGQGLTLRAGHKQTPNHPDTDDAAFPIETFTKYEPVLDGLADGSLDLVGATAWAWAREDFQQAVDVLIVDEAGQMSLANVLAVAPGGRSLVLLGDPQQLEQPLQACHPEGSDASALAHWLQGRDTLAPEQGIFLPETWRLHPAIAAFTSEIYYESRVEARPGLGHQAILPRGDRKLRFSGSGLRYLQVRHTGNQSRSLEEAEAISRLVQELLTGADWRNSQQEIAPVTPADILIVAPFNAQVAALAEAVPDLAGRIGTVDRFQGQEAAIVIYSMTSSSPEDAPRGMDFLYDGHRFNVATSRAKALCILVGSPKLFEPECRTPAQMKMANSICRFIELANEQQSRQD